MKKLGLAVLFPLILVRFLFADYHVGPHPRIFISKSGLKTLAERAEGPLSREYGLIKAEADRALAEGVRPMNNRFRVPEDLLSLGICYLVERELGHEAEPYAAAVKKCWGGGRILGLNGSGHFGYHALVYDWIYDSLSPRERRMYADSLGVWLRYYTGVPEITLKFGSWWYNQTWGPAHLNTPNNRDGITPKLFTALAILGAGSSREKDARRFLDSWARRVPAECIPAFDDMGGVWSESMGHGSYGPVVVIPWAFEAWRTATGQDLFARCKPTSFLPEMTKWAVYLTVPFSNHTAWIDDNRAGKLVAYSRVAPILGARYRDLVANWVSDESMREGWLRIPWNRFLSLDPSVKPSTPGRENYPLAYLFQGAGHVYMRSAWGDPDATWAFFGAGPKFAAHSRDDEGSFLIAKKGYLVLRAGGQGHNDNDYYAGGSLAFNIVTIYDPNEKFRRVDPGPQGRKKGTMNENDGGLVRRVYHGHEKEERGHITAYRHDARFTYVAADLTDGYSRHKVSEVTRQFLYLRTPREFFVIFDRVQATNVAFPKTWFLHMPGEPKVSGEEKVLIPGHVYSYRGNIATWLSDPAGEEGVLSKGRARAFLKTLLPKQATIIKRGGDGHQLWGHPREPQGQYNHVGERSLRPPIVPWRLEVEGPGGKKRDYFLHVLEIADENASAMSDVALVERDGYVGARIDSGGLPVEVVFSRRGPMSARLRFGDEAEQVLDVPVR